MEKNNLDYLAQVVTTNILKKMDLKVNITKKSNSCLILLPNIGFGIQENLDFIVKNYKGYEIYLGTLPHFPKEQFVERYQTINFIEFNLKNKEFVDLLYQVETTIIIGLKLSQLKALMKADDEDEVNHLILSSLMANRQVHIVVNLNTSLLNKMEEVIKELKSMGLLISNIQQTKALPIERVDLITENYVNDLNNKGIQDLVISRQQIITPLAKDKLKEYKINLQYMEDFNK